MLGRQLAKGPFSGGNWLLVFGRVVFGHHKKKDTLATGGFKYFLHVGYHRFADKSAMNGVNKYDLMKLM